MRIFDQYIDSFPSDQNAVDAVPGWNMALPSELGLNAGTIPLFADSRISWALEQFGDITERRVLELGPLEGGHSYMLSRAGAHVEAIESNRLAYLRCLVFKEIAGFENVRFRLGDFNKWLEKSDARYDLIVASGVLYHMRDPLRLLELIAMKAEAAYIWTHFVSDKAMPKNDPRRSVLSDTAVIREFHGIQVRQFKRTYLAAQQQQAFCGGMEDEHYWLERDDLLAALGTLGYRTLVTGELNDHPAGPCFSVFADRRYLVT